MSPDLFTRTAADAMDNALPPRRPDRRRIPARVVQGRGAMRVTQSWHISTPLTT